MNSKQSYRSMVTALAVIMLGLFMLCAHKQTAETPGDEFASSDDEFRQELLDMLDLADEGTGVAEFAPEEETEVATTEEVAADEEEDELLALLAGIEEEEAPAVEVEAETPEVEAGVDDDAYNRLLSEVQELEIILEERSDQVDSLRRIIDNRNARIAELQSGVEYAPAPTFATTSMTEPAPVIPGLPNYQPITIYSGPYVDTYNQGRINFESYSYDDCIQVMSGLLQEQTDHPLSDNAQYWIGESYFGKKEYQKAILEFQKVFAFSADDKYDDAQLMIGLCYVRMGQPEVARTTFGEFLDSYVGSEYSGIARRYYENI